MIKKNCVVCGKEIEVANSCYCLCSDECRRTRVKMLELKYRKCRSKSNANRLKIQKQQRWLHPRVIPCRICGKPVKPEFYDDRMHRKFYHESCVLSEALHAVSGGHGFKDKRIKRAYNLLGYTLKELREEICDR